MSLGSLRSQDLVVLAKVIACQGERPSIALLARELLLSASEAHGALARLDRAGLITATPATALVHAPAVSEFLVHGLKYVFPARRGAVCVGMATGFAAPPLNTVARPTDVPVVWPHSKGSARGEAIVPLHRKAPIAAERDSRLYEVLALMDAVREYRPGERRLAETELVKRVRRADFRERARAQARAVWTRR